VDCDEPTVRQCSTYCQALLAALTSSCASEFRRATSQAEYQRVVQHYQRQYDTHCGQYVPEVCPALECPEWMGEDEPDLCGGDVTAEMFGTFSDLAESLNTIARTPHGPVGLSLAYLYGQRLLSNKRNSNGYSLNWKVDPPPGKGCAKGKCRSDPGNPGSGTLFVCGKCVNDSAPANVMFGFIYEALGMGAWAEAKAERAGSRGGEIEWPEHDRRAVGAGRGLARAAASGSFDIEGMCDAIEQAGGLQKPGNSECENAKPCA
jgi:hypothetical protein